ncbi:MAG: SUMF1/EgtB/PvdO family nonheme iron enzyme, partial [Planctomycetes bacterium]|nr:SUMF1/EgtB/PvdO family nonheme iron enzyme [Planctomycetota bacterium]
AQIKAIDDFRKITENRRHQQEKDHDQAMAYAASLAAMKMNIERREYNDALSDYKVALRLSPNGENIVTLELQNLYNRLVTDKKQADDAELYKNNMQRVDIFTELAMKAEIETKYEDAQTKIQTALEFLPQSNDQKRIELNEAMKRISIKIADSIVKRRLSAETRETEKLRLKNIALAHSKLENVKQWSTDYSTVIVRLEIQTKKLAVAERERGEDGLSDADHDALAMVADILKKECDKLQSEKVRLMGDIFGSLKQAQELASDLKEVKAAWASYYAHRVMAADAKNDLVAAQIAADKGIEMAVDNEKYKRIFGGWASVENKSSTTALDVFSTTYAKNGALIAGEKLLHIVPGATREVQIGHYIFQYAGQNHTAAVLHREAKVVLTDQDRKHFDQLHEQIVQNIPQVPRSVYDLAFIPGGGIITEDGDERHVKALAMGRYEVSFGDYIKFLNDPHRPLLERKQDEPLLAIGNELLKRDSRGKYHLTYRQKVSAPLDAHTPIYGISYVMIEHYVTWLQKRTGLPWRLPTHEEWLLAAQGGDFRRFPWGNKLDYKNQCYSAKSQDPTYSRVYKPTGSSQLDRSVNGVCDLAGSLSEIVLTPKGGGTQVFICGGSYSDNIGELFKIVHVREIAGKRAIDNRVGFRLVIPLYK